VAGWKRRASPLTWTVLGASLMTTLGALPAFLLASQSVLVRSELGFGATRFGIVVGAFFAAAAVFAFVFGWLADRVGRRVSMVGAGVLVAGGGLGLALAAHSWGALLVAMVVLGMANAACQVTANLTMARSVPPHRRGLGFGVKQSAIPLAIVLAGLAVPTVSTTVGWRATFVATGAAGLLLLLAALRVPRASGVPPGPAEGRDSPPLGALLVMMCAITLASASANSLGAFLPSWGFEVGMTPSQAGVLLAVGSGLSIVVRVLAGHRADGRYGRNLPVVALQMVAGAVGLLVLSVPSPASVVPAAILALAVGWSWPGLMLYAAVRLGRDAPAAASGVIQGGAFVGGASGPLLFGLLVDAAGYEVAWRVAAGVILLGAVLVTLARRMFVADLVARPPRETLGYGGGRSAPARMTAPRDESAGSRAAGRQD
jgi:MFS family permease